MKPDNRSEFSLVCGEFIIIVKASSELEAAMKMAFDILQQIKQNLDAINGHKVCLQVLYTQECVRREKELSHFRAFFDRKRSNTRVGGHFRGGERNVQTRIPCGSDISPSIFI